MSRWEHEDPAVAIDKQLRVLHAARADSRADLMDAEQQAVADMHDDDRTAGRAAQAREAVDDYTTEIQQLEAERRQHLPDQRAPA